MLRIILKWLNQKQNYVNYQSSVESMISFQEKLSDMLVKGRVYFEDLQASECYIVQDISNKCDYFYENPTNHRHDFQNFNIKRNEYIYDKVNMNEAIKNYTIEDSVRNRAIALNLLHELEHSYKTSNKFIEKFDKYTYQNIFFDIKKDSVAQIKNDAENLLLQNEFIFEDFKNTYLDEIQSKSKGLEEIGIFYPFKLNHDIFKSQHFLFEINHLKFQKNDKNILEIVNKFYKNYGINCHKSKDVFTLEHYFAYPGYSYSKYFAYFDPFKNYEKYKNKYNDINENITSQKQEFKNFIFKLFDLFNEAQIAIVKFQHENLLDALITTRSKDRQYSIRDLVDIRVKQIENGELPLQGFRGQLYRAILHAFKNQPEDFVFSKTTKIDDMKGFAHVPEYFKQEARFILADFLSVINKDDSSKLQYIVDYYTEKLDVVSKEYKLNHKNKKVIHEMLLDLAFFYNNHNKEKLSKPFNSTIAKIYEENQKKSIEKRIDFDFQRKFMQQYNDYFNMYKPSEVKMEDGKIKYMMMF